MSRLLQIIITRLSATHTHPTTPSTHHQRHNSIITTASRHHHLHKTMNTTASIQHHHSTINIPPSTRQRPPKQHPHNIIYTTPCMHEKWFKPPVFISWQVTKGTFIYCFWSTSCHCFRECNCQGNIRNQVFPHHFVRFLFFFALFCCLLPLPPPSASSSSSQHHLHITTDTIPSSEHHLQSTINTLSATPPHPTIRRASRTRS